MTSLCVYDGNIISCHCDRCKLNLRPDSFFQNSYRCMKDLYISLSSASQNPRLLHYCHRCGRSENSEVAAAYSYSLSPFVDMVKMYRYILGMGRMASQAWHNLIRGRTTARRILLYLDWETVCFPSHSNCCETLFSV